MGETFLYTAYVDDATYFVKNKDSIPQIVKDLKTFFHISDLKPNYDKCEIAGIGVTKGALGALCGMKSIGLTEYTIKILGTHFSYNKHLI